MLRRVALVRTDVSEELSASFIRVTRIGELGTMLAVSWHNIPEDTILHSHRRENLKSYQELMFVVCILGMPSLNNNTEAFYFVAFLNPFEANARILHILSSLNESITVLLNHLTQCTVTYYDHD
jgi:hypothetical protein